MIAGTRNRGKREGDKPHPRTGTAGAAFFSNMHREVVTIFPVPDRLLRN